MRAVKFHAFLRKRMNTNPKRGPIHYRNPARILWRCVRGMIPHKTKRGAAALNRLRVFEGVPHPFNKTKRVVVPSALRISRLKPNRKYCRLGDLATQVCAGGSWHACVLCVYVGVLRGVRVCRCQSVAAPRSARVDTHGVVARAGGLEARCAHPEAGGEAQGPERRVLPGQEGRGAAQEEGDRAGGRQARTHRQQARLVRLLSERRRRRRRSGAGAGGRRRWRRLACGLWRVGRGHRWARAVCLCVGALAFWRAADALPARQGGDGRACRGGEEQGRGEGGEVEESRRMGHTRPQ